MDQFIGESDQEYEARILLAIDSGDLDPSLVSDIATDLIDFYVE